ncbi:MAG TPA: small basic protein [Opitutae bacterium]|nr:small basic protein [Opitutae bacterium]
MSQHASLRKSANSADASKTVLKRYERVALLKKRGQWQEGQSVLGLIKTKPEA